MGLSVKKNTAFAVETEVSEGTYVAPSAAASFIQTLQDGAELLSTKEVLERNIFTASIGKTSPRTGMFQSSGTLPVEMRSAETSGEAPQFDKLLRSALGDRKQIATTTTTKSSGNTGSVLAIENADITKFEANDIILIKEAGAYHVSPISSVDDTEDNCEITLLIPKPTGSFSNSVVIEKATIYKVADSGHPALSISKYIEGTIREYATGSKVTSMSIENFVTGQMPSMSFGFEGLNFNRDVSSIPYTPDYDSSLPPIMLDGRVYMDSTAIDVNEVTVSLENTLAYETSIAAVNGRKASRVTDRAITGTFNPYKQNDSVANFTKYKANTPFKLFAYGKNPTSTPGEFNQIVAIYMPNCLITELNEADQDGLLQDSITFSADRGVSGNIPEIYIAFI